MGFKYYRASEKPDKIRKRLTMSRYWFRDLKWVAYFAHPKGVPGHPYKGGHTLSTGQLEHPDMKRFEIGTSFYFKPVAPGKNPYDDCELTKPYKPIVQEEAFVQLKDINPICDKVLINLKKCDENKNQNCLHYYNLAVQHCMPISKQ